MDTTKDKALQVQSTNALSMCINRQFHGPKKVWRVQSTKMELQNAAKMEVWRCHEADDLSCQKLAPCTSS